MMLAGAEGLNDARRALAASALDAAQQTHLLEWYGAASLDVLALIRADPPLGRPVHPAAPPLRAEVVYACRAEMAVSLSDCMFLRARVGEIDVAAAAEAAEDAAGLMARELAWDAPEVRRQRDALEAELRRERGWMAAAPR